MWEKSEIILSCIGTSCGRQGKKSVLTGSMNFGLTTVSQTEACQTDVSLLHLNSIFRVHTGVSYAWKALSKAGGFGDLCCKVKKKGMGTSLEKHLLFKIWRAESIGFSKVLFAIAKVQSSFFPFSVCRGINLGKYKQISNPLLWDEDEIVAFPVHRQASFTEAGTYATWVKAVWQVGRI